MSQGFRFGLEAEFMLANNETFAPLWYRDVSFKTLDSIFSQIPLDGIPSLEGLAPEPPHRKLMPFIVEGYGITDSDFKVIDAYPKGIEIRTPVCQTLPEVLSVYTDLYERVKKALSPQGLAPISISHHPLESCFQGPQNKRRHDYWLWAMEVMTTYGPDINVSFPPEVTKVLFSDLDDLHAKINYYAPAMAAISLASPFYEGSPWVVKGRPGKSFRTHKRSVVAPAIELHADENFRIEFKVFEATKFITDYECYFLLVLALFLDEGLKGRASKQERVYDLGSVARNALGAEGMKERFFELYNRAFKVLSLYGFDPDPLEKLENKLLHNLTTADDMLDIYHQTHSINEVMKEYSYLVLKNGERI